MNENEARTLIERFAKTAGRAFCLPPLREDDDGCGERHPQRTEPQGDGPYLRCLRNAGGIGGHDGQHNSADRMGYRRRARKLAHGGRRQ